MFDADEAYGALNIDIAAFLPAKLTAAEFSVGDGTTQGLQLTLNGDKIVFTPSENPAQMYASGFSGVLQEANVVNALDAITLTPCCGIQRRGSEEQRRYDRKRCDWTAVGVEVKWELSLSDGL